MFKSSMAGLCAAGLLSAANRLSADDEAGLLSALFVSGLCEAGLLTALLVSDTLSSDPICLSMI